VLVFLNNLLGLGTKYEKGYCTGDTLASGIGSLESIPRLYKSLKIWAQENDDKRNEDNLFLIEAKKN
jgi:hypothetical protein